MKFNLRKALGRPQATVTTLQEATSFGLTDQDAWHHVSGGISKSGVPVNVEHSLRLTAVWACVRLISETIATLPLGLYRKKADGSRESMDSHDLTWLLKTSPNGRMTAVQFWEGVVASMLLRGNAFIYIDRRDTSRSGSNVISLDFIPPWQVEIETKANGDLQYRVSPDNGFAYLIQADDMLHIPAFSLNGKIGLTPISYATNLIGSAISAEDVASNTFRNGLHQTVAFSVDRTMNPEQRAEFRQYIQAVSGAINAGKSPVLEQGVTASTIGLNPTDAQLLESREFSAEEICRFFMVDPTLVGYSDKASNWGTGLEQKQLRFITFTLRPWLRRIEAAINKSLLTPWQQNSMYVEFSLEGLLRADSTARAQFYSQMVQNGIYTRNDCRVRENLERIDGADELTVQSNMIPIDRLGEATTRTALPATPDKTQE